MLFETRAGPLRLRWNERGLTAIEMPELPPRALRAELAKQRGAEVPLSAAPGRRRYRGGEAARRGTLAVENGGPEGPGGEDARWHGPRLGPPAGEALGRRDRRAAHRRARDRALDGGDAAHLPARAPGRAARDRLRRPQGVRPRARRTGAPFSERAARPWRALAAVSHRREPVSVARARPLVAGRGYRRREGARPAFATREGIVSTRTIGSFGSTRGPSYRRNAAGPSA